MEMCSTHALERGPEWTTARRNPRTGEEEQAVIGIPTMIALGAGYRIPGNRFVCWTLALRLLYDCVGLLGLRDF